MITVNSPFIRNIFWHRTVVELVNIIRGLSCILTGGHTRIVPLISLHRCLRAFHCLVLGTVFRHRVSTFFMVRVAAVHAS